jgi:hypothetical protein
MAVEETVQGSGLETAGDSGRRSVRDDERPARPAGASWLDQIIDRIHAAPGPSWAVYVAIFVVFLVLGHAASWLSGAVTPGALDPLALVQAFFPPFALAVVEVNAAAGLRSLGTLRPALVVDDVGAREVAADLSRTPRGMAAGAALAGSVFAVASVLTNPEVYQLRPGVGPIMWLWVLIYNPVVDALTAASIAFGLHQIHVVMRVHRDLVRVDLFRLDPLYGFSNLTAQLGILILAGTACGVGALTIVGVRFTTLELAWFGAAIPLAIVAFVVPLLGLHRRIEAEKARRHTEAGVALDGAVRELHRRLRSGDFEGMGELNSGISAATSAYATISKVSTWPWRPETLRGFASAVALPIVLWLITSMLGRVI